MNMLDRRAARVRLLVHLLSLCIVTRFFFYDQAFAQAFRQSSPFWLEMFGTALIFDVLAILSVMQMSRRASASRRLITTGPYKLVAHPAYVTYLAVDAVFLAGGSLNAYAIATGILYWIVVLAAAYNEEAHLIELVGNKAYQYYLRTPSIHFILGRLT